MSGALHTKERLALALEEHGAPSWMVAKARRGAYDDFLSDSATPELDLYNDARAHGLTAIAEGVMRGEWDATKEESDAWAASPDGQATLRMLLPPEPRTSATRGAARRKGKRR